MQYRNCSKKKLFCPPPSPPLTTPKKFTPNFFEKIFPTENEKKNLSPAYFKMFESFFLKKNNRKLINCFMLFLFFLREKFIMRYTLVNSFPHTWAWCLYVCLFLFLCFEHKWICEFPFYKKYVNTTLKKKIDFFSTTFIKTVIIGPSSLKFFLHPFFRKNKQNLL